MSAVFETSFFCPKNEGYFNYKLEQPADANQTVN